jgi:hypothetical protein
MRLLCTSHNSKSHQPLPRVATTRSITRPRYRKTCKGFSPSFDLNTRKLVRRYLLAWGLARIQCENYWMIQPFSMNHKMGTISNVMSARAGYYIMFKREGKWIQSESRSSLGKRRRIDRYLLGDCSKRK